MKFGFPVVTWLHLYSSKLYSYKDFFFQSCHNLAMHASKNNTKQSKITKNIIIYFRVLSH